MQVSKKCNCEKPSGVWLSPCEVRSGVYCPAWQGFVRKTPDPPRWMLAFGVQFLNLQSTFSLHWTGICTMFGDFCTTSLVCGKALRAKCCSIWQQLVYCHGLCNPAATSAPSIGNSLWLSCGWITTELLKFHFGNISCRPSYFPFIIGKFGRELSGYYLGI
jgi:hypothetical protein